jgi:cytochrome c-type biogenesis protein
MKSTQQKIITVLMGIILVTLLLLSACTVAQDETTPEASEGSSAGTTEEREEGAAEEEDVQDQAGEDTLAENEETQPDKEAILEDMNDIPMMDFTLKDLKGKSHTLSDYQGKIIVLNFWASWCPPCRAEMPDLEKFYQDSKGGDMAFLTVNLTDGIQEKEETARSFITKNGYTFPVLLDLETKVAEEYYVGSIPTTFIIDKDGIIRYYIPGQTNQETLDMLVENVRIVQGE